MKKGDKPGSGAEDEKEEVNANRGNKVEVDVVNGEDATDPEESAEAREGAEAPGGGAGDLASENAALLDNLQRLKAEFDNYRKRMLREQTRILETAEADLAKKLLPVIDNLERAIGSAKESGAEKLAAGVGKVLELMLDTLSKEGLEVIDPEGETFDPEYHEAMMVVETDECPEDTVIDVVQKGYRFAGVLLRPAMVRVSCPAKR